MESTFDVDVKYVSRALRQAYALFILFLILVPFGLMIAYDRALAVRAFRMIEAGRDPGMHEGFEFLIIYLYSPFVLLTSIWLAYIFFSRHPWKRSEFSWQAIVVVILGVLPSIGVDVFFISAWPTFP